jgi:uncharacterized membrane protein YphA (DoxX/SURF4 family)
MAGSRWVGSSSVGSDRWSVSVKVDPGSVDVKDMSTRAGVHTDDVPSTAGRHHSDGIGPRRALVMAARALVAAEWVNEGLYRKVLGGDPRHEEIVASIPGLSRTQALGLMRMLGLGETAIAGWVLSGRWRRNAAIAQTALVLVMNAGGLLFAGKHIPNHRRLVARSAIFIGLVWIASLDTSFESDPAPVVAS